MNQIINENKKAIGWLSIAHLVNDIYTGFLNPIMPFIAVKLGFTMALATLLIGITQICSNLFQPIFGFFADNILKRFFIFWGLILVSIFLPLASVAPNVYLLTIFMIIGCIGSSFFHPQSSGFINIFSGNKCSSYMGIFISMGSLGFALGPLLVAMIIQNYGLEKIIFTSIFGLSWAILMFYFVPKLSRSSITPAKKEFIKSFKDILTNQQIDYLLIISMMKSLVTNSSCILLPFLWKSMGHTAYYIGLALFLFVFMGALGSFVSPIIEKRLGSKPIMYFSMWVTFPLMIIFAFTYATIPVISLIIFALMGFTTMLAQPITMVWAQRTLPEYKSIISGFINGFCWGIIALVMSILGLTAEKFGTVNVLIILSIFPIFSSTFIAKLKD